MTEQTKTETPIVYKNPTPVAVAMIPVVEEVKLKLSSGEEVAVDMTKIFGHNRGIQPKLGESALIGGFVDENESIEIAAARETKEEATIVFSPDDIKLYKSEITPRNQVLVFTSTPAIDVSYASHLIENYDGSINEVQSYQLINAQTPLAFPLHEKVARKFLNEENMKNVIALGDNMQEAFTKLKAQGYFSADFELPVKNKLKM